MDLARASFFAKGFSGNDDEIPRKRYIILYMIENIKLE
jgi:hypothetical protein